MKLTFLGTGTSTGLPMLRCNCPTCTSTDPHDHRLRTSALLSTDIGNLLIDCGPDLRQQLLSIGCPDIRAALITHFHYDHVGGIDDLRAYCYPDGFDIYCAADVDATLRAHVPYCFPENHYPGAPVLNSHVIKPFEPFSIDGLEILPLPVNHYLIDCLGFRIADFAYITDAKKISSETIQRLKGVDTLVINALRIKPHISHMNLSQALNVINVVKPRQAYLTHISHDLGLHADVSPTLPQNVKIAYDGLTINVK